MFGYRDNCTPSSLGPSVTGGCASVTGGSYFPPTLEICEPRPSHESRRALKRLARWLGIFVSEE